MNATYIAAAAVAGIALVTGTATAQTPPSLVSPVVHNILPKGNPSVVSFGGRDVILRWPGVPVTDPELRFEGVRSAHSIGGDFRPQGVASRQGALEFLNATGTVHLERMFIDLSGRRLLVSDPNMIPRIPVTGDAIGFGGVKSGSTPISFPHFVMRKSIVKGVSGQHPTGCDACAGAHADGFQARGPLGNVTFREVTIESTYQAFLAAPLSSLGLAATDQQRGYWRFAKVIGRTIKPANLTAAESKEWLARAKTWFIDNTYNGWGKFDLRFESGTVWNDPTSGDRTCKAHIYGTGNIRCGRPSTDYVVRSQVGR